MSFLIAFRYFPEAPECVWSFFGLFSLGIGQVAKKRSMSVSRKFGILASIGNQRYNRNPNSSQRKILSPGMGGTMRILNL